MTVLIMCGVQENGHRVPQKEKKSFASVLYKVWLTPTAGLDRTWDYDAVDAYDNRFPKAVQGLENGLEES